MSVHEGICRPSSVLGGACNTHVDFAFTTNQLLCRCAWLSLVVFVARPGELFPVLAPLKPALLSVAILGMAFFACRGPALVREMMPLSLRPMKWFVIVGLISVVFSPYTAAAFSAWWSFILLPALLFYFWLPVACSWNSLRSVVVVVTLSAVCLVLVTSLSAPVAASTGNSRIAAGAFYDPNDLAMVLATLFPFLVFLFVDARPSRKLVWGILLLVLGVGLLRTASRGGIIAFAAGSLMFLLSARMGLKTWYKFAVFALVVGFFLSPAADPFKRRWEDLATGKDYNLTTEEEGGRGRLVHWTLAARVFAEHPLAGVGAGNSWTAMGFQFNFWRATHSSYLQVATELGVFGLLVFLLLLWRVWQNCSRALFICREDISLRSLAVLAICTRIALVTYMIAAAFISQAYSIMLPILLLVSEGIFFLARQTHEAMNEMGQGVHNSTTPSLIPACTFKPVDCTVGAVERAE